VLLPGRNVINMLFLAAALAMGGMGIAGFGGLWIGLLFILAFLFGILMTLPIGGADMPVVISLYNALTGLAVGFEGYVMGNAALMVAGMVVGSAGTLLTQLMARAMNRSLGNVLFSGFGAKGGQEASAAVGGAMKSMDIEDAAIMLAYANKVVIVPGYGMAVAQAQHKVWALAQLLQQRDVEVKFAIHPVAGRMPGHMNVLLAEADVPYEQLVEMEVINPYFPEADVVLVVGANDVTNPAAKNNKSSPLYGMPILDVERAKSIIVLKRSMRPGFAGVDNDLYYNEKCMMLFGDAKDSITKLISEMKSLL